MLLVDTLCEANYLSNTYIIGNDKECLIIDPSNDIRSIKKLVNIVLRKSKRGKVERNFLSYFFTGI